MLGGMVEEQSNVGLGCMSVSGQYDNGVPLSAEASMQFFTGVYNAGCRHFDTAEVYHSGVFGQPPGPHTVYNESQLGKFFATVPRSTFTVGTKYAPWVHGMQSDYDSVKSALRKSLSRLGLDYVDIYYSHRVLSREQGIEFVQAAQRLKQEGYLRNIGLSEVSAAWLRAAHTVHPVCCIQQEWSLLTRGIEEELTGVCKELGIGIVAYSPLARNLLAAPAERPADARRAHLPRFNPQNFEKNRQMLARLSAVAREKRCSPAQLSMVWLLQKAKELGVQCLPIPGTKNLAHALDNISTVQLTLSPEEMALLEQIATMTTGARESEDYMNFGLEGATAKL